MHVVRRQAVRGERRLVGRVGSIDGQTVTLSETIGPATVSEREVKPEGIQGQFLALPHRVAWTVLQGVEGGVRQRGNRLSPWIRLRSNNRADGHVPAQVAHCPCAGRQRQVG
jgi:hypothetical protein